MKTNRWHRLHTPRKRNNGHLIFKDTAGAVSLCDWSGNDPDQTDDGPLIVMPHTRVTVTYDRSVTFIVPVYVTRTGEMSVVWVDADTMRALADHVPLRARFDDKAHVLMNDALFAINLATLPSKED